MRAIKQRHCNCFGSLDNEMSADLGRMTGITYMATSRWGGSALLCPRQQSCPAVWGRACGSMKGPAQCLCSQPAALPSGSPQTRRSAHCLPLIPSPAQSATKEPVCSNVEAKSGCTGYLLLLLETAILHSNASVASCHAWRHELHQIWATLTTTQTAYNNSSQTVRAKVTDNRPQ